MATHGHGKELKTLSTARKVALSKKSHDISYLSDAVSRPVTVPPTLVPEEDYIYEETLAPMKGDRDAIWDEQEHIWRIIRFPSSLPTSRREVLLLESWMNKKLDAINNSNLTSIEKVQRQHKLYIIGFNEIVRQVCANCPERGDLMKKVWERYTELFQHILKVRELETFQHRQKLHQQQLMFQQLYNQKDVAFNEKYSDLQSEKERIEVDRDKFERTVLLLEEEFRKKNRLEMNLRKYVERLKVRAKEMSGFDESQDIEQPILPPDITMECFSTSNLVLVQKLTLVQETLKYVTEDTKPEEWGKELHTIMPLENVLSNLADVVSLLSERKVVTEGMKTEEVKSSNAKFQSEKGTQFEYKSLPLPIPSQIAPFLTKNTKAYDLTPFSLELTKNFVGALYVQKIQNNEECDVKEIDRMPFSHFIYNFFILLFGIRNIAEQNLLRFLSSIKEYQTNATVRLFSRTCGMSDNELQEEEIDALLYLYAQFFEGSGSEIKFAESEIENEEYLCGIVAKMCIESVFKNEKGETQQEDEMNTLLHEIDESVNVEDNMKAADFFEMFLRHIRNLSVDNEKKLRTLIQETVNSVGGETHLMCFDDFLTIAKKYSKSLTETSVSLMFGEVLSKVNVLQITEDHIVEVFTKNGLLRSEKDSHFDKRNTSIDRMSTNKTIQALIGSLKAKEFKDDEEKIQTISAFRRKMTEKYKPIETKEQISKTVQLL